MVSGPASGAVGRLKKKKKKKNNRNNNKKMLTKSQFCRFP